MRIIRLQFPAIEIILDGFLRALHALGLLDEFQSFIRDRLRLAELPTDLSELDRPVRVRRRVRVAKSPQG